MGLVYRLLPATIWDELWFARLSPSAKALWLWAATNHRVQPTGAYQVTLASIAAEVRLDEPALDAALHELGLEVTYWPDWGYLFVRRLHGQQVGVMNARNYRLAAQRQLASLPDPVRLAVVERYPELADAPPSPPAPASRPASRRPAPAPPADQLPTHDDDAPWVEPSAMTHANPSPTHPPPITMGAPPIPHPLPTHTEKVKEKEKEKVKEERVARAGADAPPDTGETVAASGAPCTLDYQLASSVPMTTPAALQASARAGRGTPLSVADRTRIEGHPLFAALVAIDGQPVTDSQYKALAKHYAPLQQLGATPETIPRLAACWPRLFGLSAETLTVRALETHWHRLIKLAQAQEVEHDRPDTDSHIAALRQLVRRPGRGTDHGATDPTDRPAGRPAAAAGD